MLNYFGSYEFLLEYCRHCL